MQYTNNSHFVYLRPIVFVRAAALGFESRSQPLVASSLTTLWKISLIVLVVIGVLFLFSTLPVAHASDRDYVWISPKQIRQLGTSGVAWSDMYQTAVQPIGAVNIADQNNNADVRLLAKIFVAVRTKNASMMRAAKVALLSAIGTESGGTTLALARNLTAYIITAQLVKLTPDERARVRAWLARVGDQVMSDGRTLRQMHEQRPNNWGMHAGAARAALAVYFRNKQELDHVAKMFKGWLGQGYAPYQFGDLCWQADPSSPLGVNPVGAYITINGVPRSIDGVLPDDQRRSGCPDSWPPPKENYVWEALQGATVEAEILFRQGFDSYNWNQQALFRAVNWLHTQADYPAEGDDTWIPHIINFRYLTGFPAPENTSPGKGMGWTSWTH